MRLVYLDTARNSAVRALLRGEILLDLGGELRIVEVVAAWLPGDADDIDYAEAIVRASDGRTYRVDEDGRARSEPSGRLAGRCGALARE